MGRLHFGEERADAEGPHRFTTDMYMPMSSARAARITIAFDVRGYEVMNQPRKANLKNPLMVSPPDARQEPRVQILRSRTSFIVDPVMAAMIFSWRRTPGVVITMTSSRRLDFISLPETSSTE